MFYVAGYKVEDQAERRWLRYHSLTRNLLARRNREGDPLHRVSRGVAALTGGGILLLAIAGAQPASGSGCAHWASRSGSGTLDDPYPVAFTEDLDAMRNCLSAHFKQTRNISVGAIAPIGSDTGPFTGSYNGDGWSLSNVIVNETGPFYAGLFGFVQEASLTKISITSGSITGGALTGALVGRAWDSTISIVSAQIPVTGTDHVGGLIGHLYGGSISDAYATGNVTGSGDYVGGLIGRIESSSSAKPIVTRAYATGDVSSPPGWDVGGLSGLVLRGIVEQTYATGDVSGSVFVAGLIGEVDGTLYEAWDGATVSDSFASGAFTTGDPGSSGPLVGFQRAPSDVFDSSAKTNAQMKDASTYVGWTIGNAWSPTAEWVICPSFNSGYPHLAAFYTAADAPCMEPPGSPSTPSATAGDGHATVTTAAGGGGTTATLQITASPGGGTCNISGTSGSCTISGLTNGTSYTFTATSTNSAGTSAASSASASVTPRASGGGSAGGGESGGSGGSGVTPAPTANPSPSPTPTPTRPPTVTPEPALATSSPAAVGALVGRGLYLSPADAALRVPTTLVPGTLTRNPRDAPVVAVQRDTIVRLSTRGLPPRTIVTTFIAIDGKWKRLGASQVGKRGRTTLPAFIPTQSGGFLLRTSSSESEYLFSKVQVD